MGFLQIAKRLATSRYLQCLFFFAVTFPVLTIHRYKSGLNFLPIHVDIEGAEKDMLEVWCQSQFGNWGKIEKDDRYTSRWRQYEIVSGVSRLCVVEKRPSLPSPPKITVKRGESWKVGEEISIKIESPTDEIIRKFPDAIFLIEFNKAIPSKLKAARKTINWQGDSQLLLVPLAQTLLFAAFLFSPFISICQKTKAS